MPQIVIDEDRDVEDQRTNLLAMLDLSDAVKGRKPKDAIIELSEEVKGALLDAKACQMGLRDRDDIPRQGYFDIRGFVELFTGALRAIREEVFGAAIRNLDELINVKKQNIAEIHYNLGLALWGYGAHNAAIESLRKAVELKPDLLSKASAAKKAILEEQRALRSALEHYDRRIETNPRDAEVWFKKAIVLLRTETKDPALVDTCFRKAVEFADDQGRTDIVHAVAIIFERRMGF